MRVIKADDLLKSIPDGVKHVVFDISDVLVSRQMKEEFLILDRGNKASEEYVPPAWYVDLLTTLKDKYTLGILSNTSVPELYRRFMRFDLHFKVQVYTLYTGLPKPHPGAFRQYLNILISHVGKINPGEVLYIDDKSCNLVVAKDLGIQTVLVLSPQKEVTVVHKPYIDLVVKDWFLYRELG